MGRFLGMLLLLGLLAGGIAWWTWANFLDTVQSTWVETEAWDVERGSTMAREIARMQEAGRLVENPWWRVWLRFRAPECLQAGRHDLPPRLTPDALGQALCQPTRRPSRRITIPEGRNLWQVADLLDEAGLAERDAFLARVFDADYAARLGVEAESLEGRLFPDTYEFDADSDVDEIIRRMHRRFREVFDAELAAHPEGLALLEETWGVDADALLILASLVETEAVVDEERPLIARVFLNRLARSMPMQTDPTCVYSAEHYGERPSPRTCRDPQSRFSTYVIPGLPPTPISAVGRASLRAVLAPADDPQVLFFVAMRDGTGRHAFSQTLAEHNRNIDRYLRRGR